MNFLDLFFPHYFYFPFIFYMVLVDSQSGGSFWIRVAVVVAAWIIGTAIYRLYFVLTPAKPQWVEDLFAVARLLSACLFSLYLWNYFGFGDVIPRVITAGVVVGFIFAAISPFWNISGHVTYTTFMIGVLTLTNTIWAVLAPVVAVMVVNRVYLNRHGLDESIGGVMLGVLGIFVFYFKDYASIPYLLPYGVL